MFWKIEIGRVGWAKKELQHSTVEDVVFKYKKMQYIHVGFDIFSINLSKWKSSANFCSLGIDVCIIPFWQAVKCWNSSCQISNVSCCF